jgi:hypothetical protein
MVSMVDGRMFAASTRRVELVLMPPLVDEPTLIECNRLGPNGRVVEVFDGRQWKPATGPGDD